MKKSTFLTKWLVMALVILLTGNLFAALPTLERTALIALYNNTDGAGWAEHYGWKDGTLDTDNFALPGTEDGWVGVTVAEVGGTDHVTVINLFQYELNGTIPSELGDLSYLTKLSLGANQQLTGTIPTTLGNLTHLEELTLCDCYMLGGAIPVELGNLSSLKRLYLGGDNLTGGIPTELGNLSNLTVLELSSNPLEGTIPKELGNLSNLTILRLGSNQLTGTIPPELGNLGNLSELYITGNSLSGSIPAALGNLSQLTIMCLTSNSLSGSIPAELGDLGQLTELSLSTNSFSGSIPVELANLSNLTELTLNRNSLSGTLPTALGSLTSLEQLGLYGNKFSGPIPVELTALTNLFYLNIGWNALYTSNSSVRTFLATNNPSWEDTQTVVPTNISAQMSGADEITVSWTPIAYTANGGRYYLYCSQTSGGPYALADSTVDKSASSLAVSGLTVGVPYYFVMQTQSDEYFLNPNIVLSDSSAEVLGQLASQDDTKMLAAPLAGIPGTTVQFANTCGGKVNRFLWNFGDGNREGYRHETKPGEKVHPSHTYADTGDYTVSLITSGWESASADTLLLPNLVCISENYAPLAVMEGSETHDGYGWAKTIDQDVFSIDGKMTADFPDVECVYSFSDSSVRNVSRVRLFIDDVYQTNYPGHLTGKFEVLVSVDNVSWTQALATSIPWEYRGQFANFTFSPVLGRYVKLKLTESHNSNANIIQLTEFQVFGVKGEDTTLEKGLLADNSPVTEFELAQNYPNPFNPTTTIRFALPEATNVSLRVYNITGRMVSELVNGRRDAGRHQVIFDAAHLSSGTYFCVLHAAGVEQVTRMILMK